jgi:hypothetical protein
MLGFLIDSEEFEVKPAVSRFFLLNEFIKSNNYNKKYINKQIDITIANFVGDGLQTQFSVGETIGSLFSVAVNGLLQERDVYYFHMAYTSKITFSEAPLEGSMITIKYYKGKSNVILDNFGKIMQVTTEYFDYTGSTTFTVTQGISSVISLDINGLVEDEGIGFDISGFNQVILLGEPVPGSRIGITYLY